MFRTDSHFVRRTLTIAILLLGCGTVDVSRAAEETNPKPSGLPTMNPVTGTGPLAPSTSTKFSFVAFGDNQGDPNLGDPNLCDPKKKTIMQKIFANMNSADPKPSFVLSLGDVVHGKDPQKTAATINASFECYVKQVGGAGIPVFNAPGNHEMDDTDDKPNCKMHRLYTETVGDLYGAFNYGNSRFIGLNTSDIPPAGVCEALNNDNLECSYISDEQLSQLKADLAANTDKTHIFVFMHYPIKPRRPEETLNPTIIPKLEAYFNDYKNVAFVLASHEHLYYNPDSKPPGENVCTIAPYSANQPARYLVSGGAGARLDTRPPTQNEAFYHYLLINVDGPNVQVTIHRIEADK